MTLRRPAVAGLPLLAVYCVPAAVLRDGLAWPLFLLAGGGFLLLVAVDSVDRMQAWGRVLSGGAGSRSPLGTVFVGARRLASVSLALAVVVPVLVPGLGERVLTGSSGRGPGNGPGTVTVLNPLLRLRADLGNRSTTPLLTYTTSAVEPGPLRIVTDDRFTGETWEPTEGQVPRANRPQDGAPLPQGLGADVPRTPEQTTISVRGLAQTYLPVPFPWSRIDVQGNWLYDAPTQNVVGDGVTSANLTYTVEHFSPRVTPELLRSAPPADQQALARYLELPAGLPAEIRRIAVAKAGEGSDYDRARNLRDWLRTFTYSEQSPGDGSTDGSEDAVLQFLQQKTGYCVHFASAMAVMLRTLGVPARVAVGFLPGSVGPLSGTGARTYSISARDAHAWPEVYFEGYGWVRFEPTPASRTSTVGDVVSGPTAPRQPRGPLASGSATRAATPSTSAKPRLGKEDLAGGGAAGPFTVADRSGQVALAVLRSPWSYLALVVLLLLATPSVVVRQARRARWRRAGTRQARAEAALDELTERLADLGVAVPVAATPRTLRGWLLAARHVPGDDREPLDRLTAEVEAARYAPPGGVSAGAAPSTDSLRDDVRAVAATVAAGVSAKRRRSALLVPGSGWELLTGAARRVDAATEGAGHRMAGRVGAGASRRMGLGGQRGR